MPTLRILARHPLFLVCALLAMVGMWSAAQAAASPFFGPASGPADGPASPAEIGEARPAGEAEQSAPTQAPAARPNASPFLGQSAAGQPGTGQNGAGTGANANAPAPAATARGNPFTAPPVPDAPARDAAAPAAWTPSGGPESMEGPRPWLPTAMWRKVLVQSARLQKELRSGMAAFARDIRENPLGRAFWLFLLAGFGYGVLHALGPGHGKSFICGYFLSRKGSLLQGLAMGTGSMLAHVASAALMVIALNLILQRTGMADFDASGALMQRGSYGLLMVMGALLSLKTLFDLLTGRMAAHGHCRADARGMTAMSLAAGLIPCPGSAVILIFAISLGIFWAGLASLLFVALGMGLTTSAFAMATILFRRAVERGVHGSGRLVVAAYAGLSLAGSLAIALLGAAMFFA